MKVIVIPKSVKKVKTLLKLMTTSDITRLADQAGLVVPHEASKKVLVKMLTKNAGSIPFTISTTFNIKAKR